MEKSNPIYLAFDPISGAEQDIEYFKIYLLNNSDDDISFYYCCYIDKKAEEAFEGEIAAGERLHLHDINFDLLNHSPKIVAEIESDTLDFEQVLNIKPKSFFKRLSDTPLLDKKTFLFELSSPRHKEEKAQAGHESLSIDPEALKQSMLEAQKNDVEVFRVKGTSVVDLHIENLVQNHSGLSNAEIVNIQLLRFKQELERAIAGGQPNMIVIHGIGKGKLKEEIFKILRTYKEVKSFNNSYHSRYGFGATEIFF